VEGGPGEFYSNHFGPDPEPEIESKFVPREKTESEKKAEAFEKILDNIKAGEGYIYKWRDKDGNLQYSNTTFPKNNPTLEIIEDLNPFARETKFSYHNGTIVVPVIIENSGERVEARLMLDTGCSTTLLHPNLINNLKPRKVNFGYSVVGDGRKIKTDYYKVDSFNVGPFTENHFLVSSFPVKGEKDYDGLLGMNFLSSHPFDIDKKNRLIRWK